jgi:actin-related protein
MKSGRGRFIFLFLSATFLSFLFFSDGGSLAVGFENPIKKFFNSNDVEAEPNKVYLLNEKNGPWLILLCSFKDKPTDKIKDAENKANTLVYELRKRFKLKAYVFAGEFNLNLKNDLKSDINLRHSDRSIAKNKKYNKGGVFVEYVVLVGDYQSPDELQKDLERIRKIEPECMFQMFPKSSAAPNRRPFPMPLAVPNPILPTSYIAQTGSNFKFIEKFNEKREFSLLSCPRKYTVQVATFNGKTVFRGDTNVNFYKNHTTKEQKTQLELAEASAEKLCRALRKHGFEAYQYHDQFSSIVTVGGFDYYKFPNGADGLRPEIVQIMNNFRGKPIKTSQLNAPYTYLPVKYDGIECDMSPKLIEIPKGIKTL